MLGISLFFSAFLAATILPLSSEVALFASIEAGLDKYTALILASFGNVLAVVFNYFLGFLLYTKTKQKLFNSKTGKKAFYLTHKYGYFALLFSFLPIIGDPITIVAGLARLNFFYFFIITATLRVARYYIIIINIS